MVTSKRGIARIGMGLLGLSIIIAVVICALNAQGQKPQIRLIGFKGETDRNVVICRISNDSDSAFSYGGYRLRVLRAGIWEDQPCPAALRTLPAHTVLEIGVFIREDCQGMPIRVGIVFQPGTAAGREGRWGRIISYIRFNLLKQEWDYEKEITWSEIKTF